MVVRIALTGGSGFIGSFIAGRLCRDGHVVTALVRDTSRRDHVEEHVDRFVVGDQDDRAAWPSLLDGAEAVVHCSVDWRSLKDSEPDRHHVGNLLGSLELLRASSPRHFVFVSTIAVHHDMRPRWKGLVDEDHPTRPGSPYGAYKSAVEAHCWADFLGHQRPFTALRPCAVYGIDPDLRRSIGATILESIRHEGCVTRPGGGKFIHVEDVADAVAACIDNERAIGHVYNLTDCYARWADWGRMAAEILQVDVDIPDTDPAQPRNTFSKERLREDLGIKPDRGHAGIRCYLEELAALTTGA